MINGVDYRIEYINLPEAIKGFTVQSNDFYTIYINLKHGPDVQDIALKHEFMHIVNNDFDKCLVNDIELNAAY